MLKAQNYAKVMKQILEKIQANSECVTQLRNKVTFNAADFQAVVSSLSFFTQTHTLNNECCFCLGSLGKEFKISWRSI